MCDEGLTGAAAAEQQQFQLQHQDSDSATAPRLLGLLSVHAPGADGAAAASGSVPGWSGGVGVGGGLGGRICPRTDYEPGVRSWERS